MFIKNSRYYKTERVTGENQAGHLVPAVKLRRLPDTPGTETVVTDSSQLDITSESQYRDATRYWHVADANSELEANELVRTTGRTINVPDK